MDTLLLTIHPQDPLWLIIALICGFFANNLKLPPLVGFLVAGFVLNAFGVESSDFLKLSADLGITLLLFTLGLKLRIETLFSKKLWGVTNVHLISITAIFCLFMLVLKHMGFSSLADLSWKKALIIAFALSFSSTVFAVKILDEMGANTTQHARTAIGVLIIQDIAAILFVAASAGKWPNIWALTLLLLVPLRFVFFKILNRVGHGELLILFGMTMAIGGADLFEMFQIKGDLGALIFGMLFANHIKANELAKGMLEFKNIFLVGFFLSVGLTAFPGWNELIIAVLIIALLPLKTILYFLLFTLFRYRTRTAWQSSLNLANFSEFGLIVGAIAVSQNWLTPSWMAVFAIVVSISFIISAPLAAAGDQLYMRWQKHLKWFDSLNPEVTLRPTPKRTEAIVFGMGRVGTSIYDTLEKTHPAKVLGVDSDVSKVKTHEQYGRHIIYGDATNPDFWQRAPKLFNKLKWIILALPSLQANLSATERLRERGFKGRIGAVTRHSDESDALKEHGVEFTFDVYTEAGHGFVADLLERY